MKMYMDSQEVSELGCREEVVQGTDTRGSVLFKALSRDGGSVNIESRSKPSCHHNSAASHPFVRTSLNLNHDDARLTDKPMLLSLLKPRDQVSTTAPSGAAVAGGRRADAVGGRRHRRYQSSSATGSSLHPDPASGLYQKRRTVPMAQMSRLKSPSHGNCNGSFSAVTTAVADSSSSLTRGGPLVLTFPPPSKGSLLASPSRSRHRPKATGPEVVLDDGSTWSALGKVKEASVSRDVSSSMDSSSDEEFRPAVMHQQQQSHVYKVPEPGFIFKGPREQFDLQQSRVLVINGVEGEPNGYVLPDSPPPSYPAVSSSLSIHPIYTNSPDSIEMGFEYEQCSENTDHLAGRLLDCPEVQSVRRLQRSVSDESSYCSSGNSSGSNTPWDDARTQDHPRSYQPQTGVDEVPVVYLSQTRVEEVPAMCPPQIHVEVVQSVENTPLDLSMGRRVTAAGDYMASQPDDGYDAPVALVVDEPAPPCLPPSSEPPSLLMQLADACSFVLEKETLTSKSCESSPPSSLSDSNSCHSVYQEENLQLPSESTYYTTSQEYLTESQENSLDNCVSLQVQELSDIKYEISNDFQPGGIILNSNVLGDRVFHDTTAFGLQQIDVCSEDDKGGVLREVANLTVEDGYGDGLYRNVYTSEGNSPSTPSMDEYHNYYRGGQDSSSGSECSSFTGRSSSSSRHGNGGMATSVICTSGGGDNKKRLRLGKAEYESMSEQDRKIRHRVLDNQRSKQYRERRRRMITKLQCDITNEENTNKALKDKYEYYEKRLILVKEAIIRVKNSSKSTVLVPTPHFVKAEC